MQMKTEVTAEGPADAHAIREVNERAFGRPDEADIVDRVRASPGFLPGLSLIARVGGMVVGHAMFSAVPVEIGGERWIAIALAPVAVTPEMQRLGVGSALIREGIRICTVQRHRLIAVIGHPEYYPRFGFVPASRFGISCNIPVPDSVFMALPLDETCNFSGYLVYPPAFF